MQLFYASIKYFYGLNLSVVLQLKILLRNLQFSIIEGYLLRIFYVIIMRIILIIISRNNKYYKRSF